MTFRPGPLRAAAVLAAGFVVVRVVYRVLFHGADGAGAVLLPLPELRLPPPFAHVVMLGPVTTDGLWDAAASAMPIALGILAFGLVNSVVDVARLFARASRRGALRGLARALAIAWATLPSLAEGARAVRFAQRLRGERGGIRMLMPLLQRTLERAANVAAALELRGFAGRGLDGDCRTAVEAHDVELAFGGTDAASLVRVPSLLLAPGALTLLSGPTGSGKSTVLRAIAGLHDHVDGGWATGSLRVVGHDRGTVPPRDLAQRVGVVLQHPRDAFATERVREEIGLALELRGVAPVIVAARVAEIADRVGVGGLLDRPTRGLSAGEATLVAIAAAIVEHPILLLVDEPLADLDADARVRVAGLLDRLAHEAGLCVVVAEHRIDALAPLADGWLRIEDGVVIEVPSLGLRHVDERGDAVPTADHRARWADVEAGTRAYGRMPLRADAGAGAGAGPVLTARDVTVRHGGTVAVASVTFDLSAGELVTLVGHNGAGKSSLLTALALPPRDAAIEASGRVALVPDASDDLFVYDTVAAECRRADHRAAKTHRVPPDEGTRRADARSTRSAPQLGGPALSKAVGRGATAARFAGFLGLDPGSRQFAARLARHPRDLSVGERRCLALALQLAGDPAVLLVDEPTRGLDPAARAVVWQALRGLTASGTAVLVASHEPEVAALGDRTLRMEAGVLSVARTATPRATTPPDRSVTSTAPGIRPSAPHAGAESWTAPGRAVAPPPEGVAPRERVAAQPLSDAASVSRPSSAPADAPAAHGSASETARARRVGAELWHARARATTSGLAPLALGAANLVTLAAFCWPLVASAVPAQAYAAVPVAALALAPLAALVVVATLDETVRSAHMLALLGTLAAIGAAVRVASTGVGGVEAVFILLILAGRAFGARFGLLLGIATIALSTLVTGTFGPWTPFQMFACAWVGAGAGLLPRRIGPHAEIAMLCVYGVIASYAFGLLMNLWFWPFAVGYGTGISYEPGGAIGTNLSSFLLYSLVTSTLTWDTLRAITSVIGILAVGRPVLAALRRAKPLARAGRALASQHAHALQ